MKSLRKRKGYKKLNKSEKPKVKFNNLSEVVEPFLSNVKKVQLQDDFKTYKDSSKVYSWKLVDYVEVSLI